jgi:signal transduction histidine kinase
LRQGVSGAGAATQETLDGYEVLIEATTGVLAATPDEPSLAAITQDLVAATTLARAKAAVAQFGALITTSIAEGRFREGVVEAAQALGEEGQRRSDTFFEQAPPDLKALLRNVQSSASTREIEATSEAIFGAAATGAPMPELDAPAYADLTTVLLGGVLGVENEIARATFAVANEERSNAITTVRLYLAGVTLGILAALAVGFLVARAITRPLRRLTVAADQLATDQLPSLVERLRSPEDSDEPVDLEPVAVGGRDEIGQLAQAFNTVQETTAQVAADQASLLRKGVSDLFVNLARRNQALLDRQIEFIDQLESNETDSDQLENLFRLDHLATRMRRNAESLLVLAGAEGPRRRGRPLPLTDVVRIAVGEVEDFTRINLLSIEEVAVDAAAAVDIAHMLAELMENATQFSPPETKVEVVGHRNRAGDYVVSVTDHGIGMSPDHLAEANEQLARPPVMGLALSRALGFTVVGRLATRHDLEVRLVASPAGGVTALTTIPAKLLADEDAPGREEAVATLPAPPAEPALAMAAPAPNGWANGAAAEVAAPAHGRANGSGAASPGRIITPLNGTSGTQPAARGDGGQSFTYYDVGESDEGLEPRRAPARPARPASPPPARPVLPPAPQPARLDLPRRPMARHGEDEADGGEVLAPVVDLRTPRPSAPARPASRSTGGPVPVERSPERPVVAAPPAGERHGGGRSAWGDEGDGGHRDRAGGAAGHAGDGGRGRLERRTSLRGLDDVGHGPAGPPASELTAAGLVRRSPKQQLRDLRDDDGQGGNPRAATSQRTPEEVRQMLSRYRTGLQRGRSMQAPSGPGVTGHDPSGEEH